MNEGKFKRDCQKIIASIAVFTIMCTYVPAIYSVVQAIEDVENNESTTEIVEELETVQTENETLDEEITISNAELKSYLLSNHDADNNGKITKSDMESIESFTYQEYQVGKIVDIEPIKYCTNLRHISLLGQSIRNIEIINQLKTLETITLSSIIGDINAIEGLENVNYLSITGCDGLRDLDWTKVSSKIENLSLRSVNITNISFLGNFQNLKYLTLESDTIEDYNPLKQLNNLESLNIGYNEKNAEVIENLNLQDLNCNQMIELNNMQVEKGKKLEITVPDIVKKAIDANSKLYSEDLSCTNAGTYDATFSDDKQKILLDTTNADIGKGYFEIYVSGQHISLHIRGDYNVFEPVNEKVEINIKDNNFKNLLLKNYDFDKDEKITNFDMLQIRNMDISSGNKISDISELEYAKNITSLSINYTDIANTSVISKLTSLESISLYGNETLKCLSQVKGLSNLKTINIWNNSASGIIDYTIFETLQQLTNLYLSDTYSENAIDINNLKKLVNLDTLSLSGKIANYELLGEFTNLRSLSLHTTNIIEEIEFVSTLTNLYSLDLSDNLINDITPLRSLEKLSNVNLLKNPINTKEVNTAETLRILRERNVYISIIETNSTTNIEFKDETFKSELLKGGADLNKDNEISIEEMQKLYNITISSNTTITSIEEIEYATNLHYLYIYGKVEDLSPITKILTLTSLSLSGNYITNEDFQIISSIKGLTSLNLSKYTSSDMDEALNIQGIEKLTRLTNLSLSGNINIENCERLTSLNELKELNIGIYTNSGTDKKILDLQGIEKLAKLEKISLSNNTKNIENLSNVPNLKTIAISGEIYDNNNQKMTSGEVMTYINTLKLEKIQHFSYNDDLNLGNILLNSTKEIKFEDLTEGLKHLYNKEDIFYNPNIELKTYNNETITIDNDKKTITFNTNNLGENWANINIIGNNFSNYINVKWINYVQGDTNQIINIPDENLKNIILEEHDIDKDGKITHHDMININSLNAYSRNIANIEGLQSATNLKYLYIENNYISDVTPILNLNKLESISLANNYLESVNFLNDAKWSNDFEYISLRNNFINFTQGNENYLIYKAFFDKLNIDEFADDKELAFESEISVQKLASKNEMDKVLDLDANLKAKLIENGIDTNKDNQITIKELYYVDDNMIEMMNVNLSGANITNISGLEYLNSWYIDLSNNNISNITPIFKNKNISLLDLSNNNISDITGIDEMFSLNELNLSHNNIENISPITNLKNIKCKANYRSTHIDLSNNKISNIECVKDWKNIYELKLCNNLITDISSLKYYNFKLSEENEYADSLTIDLSGNSINLSIEGNKLAKEVFDNKGANLKLVDKSKATEYILNKDGVFSEEANIGTINTSLSTQIDYEFVSEKNRKYYPEQSNENLVGVFVNTEYYNSPEHNSIVRAQGYEREIIVTGAIKTVFLLGQNQYINIELSIPEEYIGNEAILGELKSAEIVAKTRNTITLKMPLLTDSTDAYYNSFTCSLLLKAKDQLITNPTDNNEIISAIENEQNVILDMKEETSVISNNVFEKLSEKEQVELKVETTNAVWKFNSDGIKNKDIELNPTVTVSDTRFSDMPTGGVEDGIFIKFEHEGKLPGKAEIELDVADCNKYEEGKTIYLYYFDSEKNTYKYISTTKSQNNKIKITLEHCSEYVITEEMLFTLGDINKDGKVDVLDARMILRKNASREEFTPDEISAGDVTWDGKVDVFDARKILMYSAKLIQSFEKK